MYRVIYIHINEKKFYVIIIIISATLYPSLIKIFRDILCAVISIENLKNK